MTLEVGWHTQGAKIPNSARESLVRIQLGVLKNKSEDHTYDRRAIYARYLHYVRHSSDMCGYFILSIMEVHAMKWIWQSFPEHTLSGWYILRLHTLEDGLLHRCEYTLSPEDLKQTYIIPHIKKRMKRLMLDGIVENRKNIGRQEEDATLLN